MCVTSQPGIKICNIHCRITADLFLPILVVLFPPTFALKKKNKPETSLLRAALKNKAFLKIKGLLKGSSVKKKSH